MVCAGSKPQNLRSQYIRQQSCVQTSECDGDAYPYEATMKCARGWPPRAGDPHAPTRNVGGAYECALNWYLYFGVDADSGEQYTTCVRSADECGGLYVSEARRTCVLTSTDCRLLAGEYALEDGDVRLCVAADECAHRNRFVFELDGTCLLPGECRAHGRYAFAVTGACEPLNVEDSGSFDQSLVAQDVYSCGDDYLDTTGFWMKCVPEDKCPGLLLRQQRLCVSESACQSGNSLVSEPGYSYTDGAAKECVSAAECRLRDGHPYRNSRECSGTRPDLSGVVETVEGAY